MSLPVTQNKVIYMIRCSFYKQNLTPVDRCGKQCCRRCGLHVAPTPLDASRVAFRYSHVKMWPVFKPHHSLPWVINNLSSRSDSLTQPLMLLCRLCVFVPSCVSMLMCAGVCVQVFAPIISSNDWQCPPSSTPPHPPPILPFLPLLTLLSSACH